MPDHPAENGKTYHEYTPEEREAIAMGRFHALMAAHGEVTAMLTFLSFGYQAVPLAAAKGDIDQVKLAITAVRVDVNDVAAAANKLVATYAEVLDGIAKEWLDTNAYLAWKGGKETTPE